jgi:hypothetical protein
MTPEELQRSREIMEWGVMTMLNASHELTDYIVESEDHIHKLLAEVERLQAEVERLHDILEDMRQEE